MNSSLLTTTSETFGLLSFGKRGVGKTVFLAGSYAELHSYSEPDNPHQVWFDCQDGEVLFRVKEIFNYIAASGKYPPPTMKITTFDFSLKQSSRRGAETLAYFRWWDTPGEVCDLANYDFRTMVLNSNGCCVFIDAFELVHNRVYSQELERDVFLQVKALAKLVSLNRVKYRFAIILTKCDLIELDSPTIEHIEENLQPLTTYLNALKVNYQTFYSKIPIASSDGIATLEAKGAADPLLWLVSELSKIHKPGIVNNISNFFRRNTQNGFSRQQEVFNHLKHSATAQADTLSRVEKLLGLSLSFTTYKYILLISLFISLIGVIGFSSEKYQLFRQYKSTMNEYEQFK